MKRIWQVPLLKLKLWVVFESLCSPPTDSIVPSLYIFILYYTESYRDYYTDICIESVDKKKCIESKRVFTTTTTTVFLLYNFMAIFEDMGKNQWGLFCSLRSIETITH